MASFTVANVPTEIELQQPPVIVSPYEDSVIAEWKAQISQLRNEASATRGTRPRSIFHRLVEKLVEDGDCLIFVGAKHEFGYGAIATGQRPSQALVAHVVLYEYVVGEVERPLELDHLCRRPACCAIWHLELVTRQENTLRGLHGRLVTQCPVGHPYTPENTGRKNGRRVCLKCWGPGGIKLTAAYRLTRRAERGLTHG